jgi:hypothetical protein
MPHTPTLTLPDEAFETLSKAAAQQKKSLEQLALERLAVTVSELPKKVGSLEALFGSVSLGHPTGADNESIDRDLMLAYADNHEND